MFKFKQQFKRWATRRMGWPYLILTMRRAWFKEFKRLQYAEPQPVENLEFVWLSELEKRGSRRIEVREIYPPCRAIAPDERAWPAAVARKWQNKTRPLLPAAIVMLMSEGLVLRQGGIAGPDEQTFLEDIASEGCRVAHFSRAVEQQLAQGERERLDALCTPLCNLMKFDNYFDWLLQTFPRLHLLQRAGCFEAIERFLIPMPLSGYMRETVGYLKLPPERLHLMAPVTRCRDLVVASTPCGGEHTDPWVVDFLREAVPRADDAPRHEKIYVYRGETTRRRCVNEAALMERLQSLGFAIVEPGRMSVSQQAACFDAAKVVVGVHGAALANFAFCRPGTRVVELMPANYIAFFFANLAAAAGCEYRLVVGREPSLAATVRVGISAADLRVDVDEVCRALS